MKKLVAIALLFVAVSGFAEWSGASMWAGMVKRGTTITEAGAFMGGYFTAVESLVLLSDQDRKLLALASLQIDSGQLENAVNAFYGNTNNAEPSVDFALKFCLEDLISRTKDGKRLLNLIYAQVGGWKPFTTWAEYQSR